MTNYAKLCQIRTKTEQINFVIGSFSSLDKKYILINVNFCVIEFCYVGSSQYFKILKPHRRTKQYPITISNISIFKEKIPVLYLE